MNIRRNVIVSGQHKLPVLLDLYYQENQQAKPVIVFAHGFKGFKDWGFWDLIATAFAEAGFVFIKFNFSHNGTTLDRPSDFDDLTAFGQNNYTIELADLEVVLDWIASLPATEVDQNQIGLIGHSRGGGIGIIKAQQDPRIKALTTWAAVSRLDYAWQDPAQVEQWKTSGVYYITNGRTKQQMPLEYQIYEDFQKHLPAYDTKVALAALQCPLLIIHGTDDPAIPSTAAQVIHQATGGSAQLHLIEAANHVFGGNHPYTEPSLPPHAQELVEVSLAFFKTHLF